MPETQANSSPLSSVRASAGKRGGKRRTKAKREAARLNGAKGGRPRKSDLMLGDCLDVMPTLRKHSISLIFCDLPYGITRNHWDSEVSLPELWKQIRRVLKPNGVVLFTGVQPYSSRVVLTNPRWFRYELVWEKCKSTGFLNARKQPLRKHEQILVFYRKRPTYTPQMGTGAPYVRSVTRRHSGNWDSHSKHTVTVSNGTRFPVSILRFKMDKPALHPTQKPVALLEYLIKTYTADGDTVLDPAAGSGTTGVACKLLNRRFIGIEKESDYLQIAASRIKKARVSNTDEG